MLICNVSLRPARPAIAASLAEAAAAIDSSTTGTVIFAALVDDPANVRDTVNAYLGQIMLEAANAATTQDATSFAAPPTVTPTTFNPSDLANIALSGGNLTATANTATAGVRSVVARSSLKYYWEATLTTTLGSGTEVGLATASAALAGNGVAGQAVWTRATGASGRIWINGTDSGIGLGAPAAGDKLGIAVDLTAGRIWFRITPSGNWNASGTANPATGVGGISLGALAGTTLYAFFAGSFAADKITANFGASAFNGTVPAGYGSGWG